TPPLWFSRDVIGVGRRCTAPKPARRRTGRTTGRNVFEIWSLVCMMTIILITAFLICFIFGISAYTNYLVYLYVYATWEEICGDGRAILEPGREALKGAHI